jgi:hypothetical protein
MQKRALGSSSDPQLWQCVGRTICGSAGGGGTRVPHSMQNLAFAGSSAPQLAQRSAPTLGVLGMLAIALAAAGAGSGASGSDPSFGFAGVGGVVVGAGAFATGWGNGSSAPQLSQNAVPGRLS